MNSILLFDSDFTSPTTVRLTGRRLAHVALVHKAAAGDTLKVGLLGGKLGQGRVVLLDDTALELELTLDRDPPPPLAATLVVALPRPKSMRRVLHVAVTMGVKRVCFVNSHRVDKSYWQSPMLAEGKQREIVHLGLEQAVDTIAPKVSFHKRLTWFVEDDLPALSRGCLALIAHPPAANACPAQVGRPLALAIGPEGGFVDYEIEYFVKAGFAAVSLGPRILRVEEAVPALLGRLC
jgi:16S rRNA (uracil1498-N3)-methyltransferase